MCHQMFQLLNIQKQDVYVDIVSSHICAFDILIEDGPSQECSALLPLRCEHDNLLGTCGNNEDSWKALGDNLSKIS